VLTGTAQAIATRMLASSIDALESMVRGVETRSARRVADEVAKRWNRRWGVSSLGTPAANPVNTKSDQADNEAQDRNPGASR
jgi:hypothetical protein